MKTYLLKLEDEEKEVLDIYTKYIKRSESFKSYIMNLIYSDMSENLIAIGASIDADIFKCSDFIDFIEKRVVENEDLKFLEESRKTATDKEMIKTLDIAIKNMKGKNSEKEIKEVKQAIEVYRRKYE
ncbi:MAG TPA: hypothetical protein DCP90_01935 [Clostridiales bacterium]|nr:MAG: hypothetical protein A2Y22_08720 [Clostridiales bacterium GWD2_32_59]HAN09353.1 hypothetical protein [Clostridiales bacterium]